MRITKRGNFISLDQNQYVKNIVSRFEKAFKYPFKVKDFPLPISFVYTMNSLVIDGQMKKTKTRFGDLHYRSVIGPILYVSYCTRPDICFAVNKKIPRLFLQILHEMTLLTMVRVLTEIRQWHKDMLLIIVVIYLFQWLCLVERPNIFQLLLHV